jgi:hypothetical protein
MKGVWRLTGGDQRGAIFLSGLVFVMIMTILGVALFDLSMIEGRLATGDVVSSQVLYCAEAALGRTMNDSAIGGRVEQINTAVLTPGTTRTWAETVTSRAGSCSNTIAFQDLANVNCPGGRCRYLTATSTGSGGTRRGVRIQLNFLAPPFEYALVGNNGNLVLRGDGAPNPSGPGGHDIVNGDVFVNGNVLLGTPGSGTQSVQVNPFSPSDTRPTISLPSGSSFTVSDNSNAFPKSGDSIPTGTRSGMPTPDIPGYVAGVKAAVGITGGNTVGNPTGTYQGSPVYNLAAIFSALGANSNGSLRQPSGCGCGGSPTGNCGTYCQLQQVAPMKNPSDRAAEVASMPGNSYYLDGVYTGEMFSSQGKTGQQGAQRLLDFAAGSSQPPIFLVDGNARFSTYDSYGFGVNGRATIVSTQNVIFSDNMIYKDGITNTNVSTADLVGYVAQNDIWFGDPQFGTFVEGSGVMLAGRDFNYMFFKADGSCCLAPDNAVTLNGTMLANRQIAVFRDWAHTTSPNANCPPNSQACQAVSFDPASGTWKFLTRDAQGNVIFDTSMSAFTECTSGSGCPAGTRQISHYQMTVNYETRLRTNSNLVPPGLPTGAGVIFAGTWKDWQECPPPLYQCS